MTDATTFHLRLAFGQYPQLTYYSSLLCYHRKPISKKILRLFETGQCAFPEARLKQAKPDELAMLPQQTGCHPPTETCYRGLSTWMELASLQKIALVYGS